MLNRELSIFEYFFGDSTIGLDYWSSGDCEDHVKNMIMDLNLYSDWDADDIDWEEIAYLVNDIVTVNQYESAEYLSEQIKWDMMA